MLTVGGRLNDECPNNDCPDFDWDQNVTIGPGRTYEYQGNLTLAQPGNYHFFCAYQTPDGNWNTSIGLGPGLTDKDRIKDIIVYSRSDGAIFIADVTIPDGTHMSPGQSFTKIWRIQNTGTTTWSSGYEWGFTRGSQMGGPNSVTVSGISPGNTVDISVDLVAPTSPGIFTGYWRMRNSSGNWFGQECWVNIVVCDDKTSWEFNIPENFEGWSVEGVSDAIVDFEGHLVINPATDPRISSPLLSLDTQLYNAVDFSMISYAENQEGQIYFKKTTGDYNETDSVHFTVHNNPPEWHRYLIYCGDKPGWTGTIRGIRIDPARDGNIEGSYDDIAIDWIKLVEFTDPAEDSLVQTTGVDTVYLFQRGRRWSFISGEMFEAMGYDWSEIVFCSPGVLDRYNIGPTIISEGTLIRKYGSEPVYLIQNSQMRWITSPAASDEQGFKDEDIYVVPNDNGWNFVASLYPRGPDITIPPSVIVSIPNGGENWQVGSQQNIVWVATDDDGVESVSLYYSTNGGGSWIPIEYGESNDGIYPWEVPNTPSTLCKAKIVAYDTSGVTGEDVSNSSFTILKVNIPPTVSITGGPTGLTNDNTPSFSWTGSDSDGSVVGYYYDIDDSTPDIWTTNTSHTFGPLNDGYHAFYVKAEDNDGAHSDLATQGFRIDTGSPTIVSRIPQPDETNVPVTTNIQVTFSEPMNQSATEGAFLVTPSVNGTRAWAINTLVFSPSGTLAYDTVYIVTIDSQAIDLAGNPLCPASWSFTTEAGTPKIIHVAVGG